jgi:hypothetical protein
MLAVMVTAKNVRATGRRVRPLAARNQPRTIESSEITDRELEGSKGGPPTFW